MKPLLCLLGLVLTSFMAHSQPLLSSPTSGATDQPLDVVLQWRPTGAPTYQVECLRTGSSEPDVVLFSASGSVVAKGLDWLTQYRWRVREMDSVPGPWSAEGTFTTEASGSRPVPVSPAHEAIGVAPMVVFQWTDDIPSSQYELQIDTTDFVATSQTFTSSTLSITQVLLPSTAYRWRLREVSAAGGPGPWTKTMEFTTEVPPGNPASAPILLAPANTSTVEGQRVVCSWSVPREAIDYDLRLVSDAEGDTGVIFTGIEDASLDVPLSSTPTTWHWSVRTRTQNGLSEWSEEWSFSTLQSIDSSRQIPTPVLPLDNSTVLDGSQDSITLEWIQPDSDVQFVVQYALNDDLSDTSSVQITSTRSLRIAQPPVGTVVRWRVATSTWWSVSPWSTDFLFRIGESSDEPPSKPRLIEPANGAMNVDLLPSLLWQQTQGSESYEVQLTDSETFETITFCIGTGDTTTVADTIQRGRQYWWRARGLRSSLIGEWSDVYRFATNATSDVQDINIESGVVIAPQPAIASIRVMLPDHTAQGVLELLDVRGRHVRTVVIEENTHHVVIEGVDLPPGFYTLIARLGATTSFHSVSLLP
ncbi:MAG: hypothetical protein IPF79_11450 [Ignavibacteria bacterium]|nr:hypothetical protein [Ignavibacteria bacterium]